MVDTFEYRLLREVEFRESLTCRYVGEMDAQIVTTVDCSLGPVAPPQIAQKPRNLKLEEGSDAIFQAKVTANPKPRLTWSKNGQRTVPSQKYRTSFSNQQATINIPNARAEDSGHYTLLAENPQGCVVSSAYLAIEQTAVQDGFYDSQRASAVKSSQVESGVVDSSEGKTLAPNFVRVCADRDALEVKMTRFDCCVTGCPYPEVHWFINGHQVSDDATHKILVDESGNHALMITNVSRSDAGVFFCIARNKSGDTSFQCNWNVIEKEQVVAPKFVERFTTVHVKEGEPVVLNARAVGTPIPRITWQKDGVPIVPGPDVHITIDSGASTLDIPRAKASDAAWYQCTAQNVAGSTATRARLFVETPKGSAPEPRRLNLPRPTKVIEPELAPGPEVIYLRHVERAKPHAPQPEEERIYPPPQFIVPLRDVSQIEGGRVHFEARIEPVGDPTMRVDWFVNGRPLEASSRATTTFRFGFIALDLISIILEDSGEYVCRVTSQSGCVESQALLSVTGRASIEQSSQHPHSLQYLQQLEDYSRYQRTESVEETSAQRPAFIRPLQQLGELQEGRNAHFEAQLTPVSDPTMKVEWYKDGRPITASSRITTIFNFGYVSLNIMHLRVEDAGTYTVRAVNRLGEAISTSTLRVQARTSVTGDLGFPEQQRYIEKVEELEAYQQQQHYKYVQEVPECTTPPEFKSPIRDQNNIREGGFAHFEARLEPIGDSTLQVEWLKDGRPVEASSRITTFFNFGYVALTIKHVTTHDIGVYTCRAYNRIGQATTSAQLTVVSKKDIILDSQHPGGLEKIHYLEDTSRYGCSVQEETTVSQKPRFLGPLKGTNKIVEGQRAHFEAKVEPQNDMTLKIEWYFNGRAIQSANRIQTYHDFGYVTIDILSVRSGDAGTYKVVARNALGEAQLSATMEVEVRSSIDTTSMHRSAMEKMQHLEGSKFVEPQYHIEEISKSKPIFVQPLSDPKPVNEGKNIHLECRLEPMGDPTMRVEWFYNGRPVTVGSRFRTYYDFGYVALDIIHATAVDSGEYTVRATNHLGSAHSSACVRVISRSDIVTDTQHEAALEQIQMLEDSSRYRKHVTDDITVVQPPQFTRPLHNLETIEGTNVHLECRLQPVGDPSMRVDWFVNGRPVPTGHRFRPAYDFDYVALDLLGVYPVDSGVYTCQARNQLGEAVTSCSVRVIARKDLILDSQHPSGFEKIQYLEDSSRYKKSEYVDEVVNIKPRFLTKPKSLESMREGQHAHFECKLEPVTDSNLKVEWYKNGRPITVGHRFRPIHDFGYVALDIIDLIAEDSGTYTCRAVNLVGADETTCTLVCRSGAQIVTGTQNESGLEQIQYLEDRSRFQRSEFVEETTKQAPIFTTSLKHIDIKEGQRAHFECRLIPVSDPTMKVEWFHNNVPVKSGSRFTETNNFGFVALDILYCYPEDSGTYTCRAKNIVGEAVTSANLSVHSKKSIYLESQHESALNRINYLEDTSRYQRQAVQEEVITQAPVFTQPMRDIRVAENQAVHFEARLIPVGDPKLKVEWLRNGVPIQASNRVTTMHDFGYVALNMKYVYPEDSGTYTCRATNELGQAVTSSTLVVHSKASLLLESQHEGALQKLHMLEDSSRYHRREEEEIVVTQAPHFTAQLNGPTNLMEAQSAHYECRIEPYPDPNLKVEWFHNGKPLQTGHRFRTTYDFGFAALDILSVYPEDSGEYTCKATNKLGTATSSIKLNVKSRSSIILDTQHEGALQKIQYLEDDSRYKRTKTEDTVIAEKPQFGRPLRNVEHLPEGLNVHLEATLTPVNDPTMKVEWYCNGRPIPQGHRFKTTYDFGFVALDILYAYAEDSGTYMCKAKNAVGEAVTTCSVKVEAKAGLYLDTLDEQRLKKIRDLEAYERPSKAEVEPQAQKPVFITPLNSLENLKEGDHAHLECRVEPINDPNLKIEWFVNGIAIKTGHRFRTTHDFGYVALDVLYTYPDDSGTYMAKATNLLGEAVNTCQITVGAKASIQLETKHPEGMRKIQQLEEGRAPARPDEPERVFEKPIFTQLLTGLSELWEGQHAHFECRVVPVGDPTLRFEWFVNGIELKMGSRFHVTHDFGFVTLDIHSVVTADAGVYMCKAVNSAGEAVSSISLKVKSRSSIVGEPLQPDAWQKIQLKEAEMNKVPEMFVDTTPQQAPVFTTHLVSHDKLVEGQHIMLEAQVEPRADPNLRIEWFKNGISLTTGTRIRSTFDFGLVTLTVNGLRPDDSAIYTCKATNLLGEAVSTCTLKIEDRHWLLGGSLRPEALPIIEGLEAPRGGQREEPEPVYESPVFITHLNNVECREGDSVHFECHVEPSKDPTLSIEWFVNGKPLPSGARFKSTYDFGYVSLDINHAYAEDSGVYMCKATNTKGQAQTSGTLRCTSKTNIYLDTQHPQGKAGLEKVQEAEDAFLSKYQRQVSGPEATYPKPVFTTPLKPQFSLGEAEPLHLECTVEPKEDPNLKVEWYFNGKALEHGSRFKMTCDFGYVTLHLTDVYERDQGIYTCKAYNLAGETFTSTTIYCTGKEGLIWQTQHPKGAEGLEKIQDLEESLRRQEGALPEGEEGHPPVFTSQFENLKNLSEGDIAHFEASLTPVGDQTMVVEWFYKGEVLKASHRTRTVHAFGMVVLEILGTKIEDSGTYTCRATNKWGRAEISVELECVEKTKGQKPQFTSHIQSLEGLKDGDSAHFECTLIPVGDPHLKVEWFHNGQPIRHSSRMKSVSDFGFVVMDISYLQSHDSGEYVCRASNRYGEDFTRATVKCAGKGGVYLDTLQPDSLARIRELEVGQGVQPQAPTTPILEPPKFITHISNITQLVEGQSAHFEARLTPVNDPNLTVEWYYNGKKLPHGHRYRTFHDFGIVILDILYCYEENSGEYECRAVNKIGQDSTKATLRCVSKANLILESQLPRGMEGGLEKIQTLEDSMFRTRDERSTESRGQAPVFTVPLSNIDSLREGENAHFEARLTPTDDPKLKVEWFWNGKPLKTGSRFRTFCDFGFVILEISPVYPEDSGEYSCRAFNDYGQAVTTASMKVQGKRSIILESQLPKGMERTIEKIAELEGLGAVPGQTSPEEDSGKPPEFITTPADLTLTENSLAHFECQLTPVNDSSMRVEWFHNGKPLSAGSRIKTINDFGFVILEVAGVYQRDSGLYTCKATNRHGEATVSCKLQVRGRQGIIMEPQLPTNFRTGTESIQKLEEALYKRDEILSEEEKPDPPRFTVELKDIVDVPEGGAIHFECRVEPVGDSTMRIDWFHNGRPFATGSRVHMLNDFGFVVLDMDYTYARDSGEYLCRATNKWGSATTKATLTCKAKRDIVLDSQLPEGMSGEKLKELERGPVSHALPEEAPLSPPKFITQIESVGIGEGEPVHFECRVEPKTDPKLRVEWYRNGKILPTGHRFRTLYDMGFVSLDILYTYPEDSGEYVCRAVNDLGEDTTRATISCKKLPTIILQNQVPKGMKKSEALMQMEATIKKYTSEVFLTEDDLYDVEKKQPPRFVTQIQDQTSLVEMQSSKFECQLAPVGDPHMKVEWFFNGKPLPHKNRFTPIYDFGYVAMNFGWVYPEDSGEYLCRATNLYGMDETRAIIKTAGKPGIIYESQLPKGMKSIERIREMEAAWQVVPEEAVEDLKPKQAPAFVTKPEPFTVTEGEMARFCCRVTGHPKPRVMWVVNGHTVVNGTRYKLTYDGMWHLDIPKTRQYDHGKVEVIARNSAGEAVAVTDLTVKPRQDDYRNVLKNSPRPWYDYELTQYQKERQETELERVFEERNASAQQVEIGEHLGKQKLIKEPETEWQQSVKKKKGEEYYSKLKELEDEQVIKETRLREASHQFAIPGEKVMHKSLAKGMAQSYEDKLDRKEEIPSSLVRHAAEKSVDSQAVTETSETSVDSQKVTAGFPPQPSESAIHGREVHVAKQKQTQKEVRGDLEITRKITATETTEVEHKARTQERVVQGQVKPSKPPFFTKKIQPCRAFEQSQARFEVEFDGDPLPKVKWFREDFPIQSSPDLQIHTFGTKSILIVRQVFMEDSGVFSVVAENTGGSAKCSANLVVEERRRHGRGGVIPPSFLTTVQDTNIAVGQLARFDARVTGTKPLDVYWLKNGKKITSDIRYKTLEEDNMYTLLIIEAFPEDTGKYECVAINSAGEARCDAQLLVQQPSPATPSKTQPSKPATPGTEQAPSVVEPLKAQVIREGQAVAFRCKISGRPVPDIKWLKGDKVIKPSKYFQMQKDGDVYTLRISEAFPEDEGVYKCIATNSAGDVTLSAELRVLAPETQEVTPTLTPMRDVIVPEGSPAQFRTQVSGKPQPTIQWLRDGLVIPQSADFQMIHEGANVVLLIATTFEEDSGTFTCRATNSAGQVETSAQLIVKKKEESGMAPYFVQPLKPQVVQPKEVATLQCTVRGTPTPTVKWYHSDKELKPGRSQEIKYSPETGIATLRILKPMEQDQAIYTVRATNTHGRAECRANLIVAETLAVHKPEVLQAPKIIQPVQAKMVTAGDSVTLEADFEGAPKPEVRWYRNGKEITPSDKVNIVVEEHKTTLHIPQVFRPDGGKYEVRATNPAGEARSSGTISVTTGPEPKLSEVVPPRFIEPLKPQIVAEGEVIIMETHVESHPVCSFQWFQHSVAVKSSPEMRVVTTDNRSVLIIREVASEHDGIYTCRAENVAGSVTCTATLNVVPATEWEDVAELVSPTFVKKVANVRVMDGEEVHFTCQVTGRPIPKITWYHKNEPIKEAKDVTIYQDSEGVCKLAISEVFPEDAGEYTCHAINKVGEAVCAASLIVEAYEYIPDAEIATVTTGTSLTVEQSGSEEELLTEKEIVSEVLEEKLDKEVPQEEDGTAPKYITPLQKVYPSRDGELIRMEVKVDGKPKPKVKWYKQGDEVVPSKDFQVEEYDDGTSVLTIPEVFPDDTGEVTCVAENDFGVATTSTELVVEGIMGTKEYRKPEWVTQMEELKEQLRGNNVAMSCMPEHGASDNDVMSVDSLETESVHHLHVDLGPARKRAEVQLGSMPSLEDMSIGDDSVFVSNTSSYSDTLNCAAMESSAVHVSVTETPCLLDSSHSCHGDNLHPSVQTALPKNETISDVDTSSVSTSSDYAHLVMTDYLNSHRHSITAAIEALDTSSSVKGELDCASKVLNNSSGSNEHNEEFVSVEGPVLCLHECKEKSEEVLEIVYVSENENCDKSHPTSSSFYLLSPIQESSEPSTESSYNAGSDGVGARNYLDKHEHSTMKFLSASCEVISSTDASMTSHNLQTKYQTFPRSKIPVFNPIRSNACYSVPEDPTLYPLEPRELDPAGFHQLHMADSQEELQEFLLLESQCMTLDGHGLAAAFIVSDDEDSHSDDDDRGAVSDH